MRVLIIGCGYVGIPLGRELVRRGHQVWGLRRSPAAEGQMRAAGITPLLADAADRSQLSQLPRDFEWVVNLVSSGRGGVGEYVRSYVEGNRAVVDWLAGGPVQKYVYTSSTSVYGQSDGSEVDEGSDTVPPSATSRVLLEAEEVLREAWRVRSFPAVILRVAGIYGPGRGHLFQRFMHGEAEMTGTGTRLLNMIHVDDLVGVIIAALENGTPGETLNAVDDEPVTERKFFEWLAQRTGRGMPPERSEADQKERKRGLTSKRVLNSRLKESLGYRFTFPSYREGYERELEERESGTK